MFCGDDGGDVDEEDVLVSHADAPEAQLTNAQKLKKNMIRFRGVAFLFVVIFVVVGTWNLYQISKPVKDGNVNNNGGTVFYTYAIAVQWMPILLDVFQMTFQHGYLHLTEVHTVEHPRVFFIREKVAKMILEVKGTRDLESLVDKLDAKKDDLTSTKDQLERWLLSYGGFLFLVSVAICVVFVKMEVHAIANKFFSRSTLPCYLIGGVSGVLGFLSLRHVLTRKVWKDEAEADTRFDSDLIDESLLQKFNAPLPSYFGSLFDSNIKCGFYFVILGIMALGVGRMSSFNVCNVNESSRFNYTTDSRTGSHIDLARYGWFVYASDRPEDQIKVTVTDGSTYTLKCGSSGSMEVVEP